MILYIYINKLWYDNRQKCFNPSIQKLWLKINRSLDCIDKDNIMNYMNKKEFYRHIPRLRKY